MEQLSVYEREAIKTISRATTHPEMFLAQLAKATCASRNYTGVGLYTNIVVESVAPRLPLDIWKMEEFPQGHADHPEVPVGVGIILWLKDGYISCLESYTYEGSWPRDESLFRVSA